MASGWVGRRVSGQFQGRAREEAVFTIDGYAQRLAALCEDADVRSDLPLRK